MLTLLAVADRAVVRTSIFGLLFGATLVATGVDLGGPIGVFTGLLIAALVPSRERKERRRPQGPEQENMSLADRLGLTLLLTAVVVADVIFGSRLFHRYGAAALFVPPISVWLLTVIRTDRRRADSVLSDRAGRVRNVAYWLGTIGLGVVFLCGIPSSRDEQFGALVLGGLIASSDTIWAPVRRRLGPVVRCAERLLTRAEPAIGFTDTSEELSRR